MIRGSPLTRVPFFAAVTGWNELVVYFCARETQKCESKGLVPLPEGGTSGIM